MSHMVEDHVKAVTLFRSQATLEGHLRMVKEVDWMTRTARR